MRIQSLTALFLTALSASTLLASAPLRAEEGPHTAPITTLADGPLGELARHETVIAAIRAQNELTGGYDQAQIDALDQDWRAQTTAGDRPLIDEVLAKPVSAFLAEQQSASEGLYTEIFIMDAKGLNVGQSAVTSDYWQGDEAKWQETFGVGADARHISDVEFDDSTQSFQAQLSLPVVDGEEVIGAMTVGINIDLLMMMQ